MKNTIFTVFASERGQVLLWEKAVVGSFESGEVTDAG